MYNTLTQTCVEPINLSSV